MEEFDESPPASRPKPSKIPSWIMLGFLMGALFVWALPRPRPASPAPAPVTPVISAPASATHPRFSDLEASFLEWQQYALLSGERGYVVMWDAESRSFRDCYEVLRRSDEFFFRSVPRPRNLRAREDVPANSPLQFLIPVSEARGPLSAPVPAKDSPRPPM